MTQQELNSQFDAAACQNQQLQGGQLCYYGNNNGTVTIGSASSAEYCRHCRNYHGLFNGCSTSAYTAPISFERGLRQFGLNQGEKMSGQKPIVICNGTTTEAKDQADAQAIAERLAHQHQADAYILKPIKKVAPKRDVVTTDLE